MARAGLNGWTAAGLIQSAPVSMAAQRAFLTATWRDIALINFEAPAAMLAPLVPRGTELDRHRGVVFVSLVGFRFLNTRVLGCRVPAHVDFDEVNLRFYVRREAEGEERRAVTFVKEIVPRRLIASIARAAYNEPYVALPMHGEVRTGDADASTRARYGWTSRAGEHHIEVLARGELQLRWRTRTKHSSPSTTGARRGSAMAERSSTASPTPGGGFVRPLPPLLKATWPPSTVPSGARCCRRGRSPPTSQKARR